MLVFILISLLYCEGNCRILPVDLNNNTELIKCVTDIVSEYFAQQKVLTYVGNGQDDDDFIQAIHKLNVVAMTSTRATFALPTPHESYIISSSKLTSFTNLFSYLTKESTWNPAARFLIIVSSLKDFHLKYIFDKLLKYHVNNVIIVNATDEAHLYSYNPFDKTACGKSYDEIISYGKCSQGHISNLFPDKYVTKLRNCSFTVGISQTPPFTIVPRNNTDTSHRLSYGVEPYFLRILGEKEGFTLSMVEYKLTYSTVSTDMEVIGPLKMLQNNEADIVLGGLFLTPSRTHAFDYIYDLFPYIDEIRFFVRRASFLSPETNLYLEFDVTVWMLIILSLFFYSIVMIILLGAKDKSLVVLKLLDSLVIHSCNIQCHSIAKFVFLLWIWFTYLINSFYQSSLVSFTAHPALEHQISTEQDILHHNLKPCFCEFMQKFYMESMQSNETYTSTPGCKGANETFTTVKNSKEYYTMFLYGSSQYKKQQFWDEYGDPHIYALKTPYSKVSYGMYFYKGFPLAHDLRVIALRLREIGLVDKAMSDMSYVEIIKRQYHAKKHESRFAIPWKVFIVGLSVAVITLIVEILFNHSF